MYKSSTSLTLLLFLSLLGQGALAADYNTPPWPLYMDGQPVDASGIGVQLPYCWRYVYAAPTEPHGTGSYLSNELIVDYVPFVGCFSPGAVLQWPDPRLSVPSKWAALPRVGDEAVSYDCAPTGKEFIANPAGKDFGPLYRCELDSSKNGGTTHGL